MDETDSLPQPPNEEQHAVPKKLETLSKEINAAYENELTAIANRTGIEYTSNVGTESLRPKKIRELLEGTATNDDDDDGEDPSRQNPLLLSSMKLNVIRSWRHLFDALLKHNVFLEYVHSMKEAFREIEETPAPETAPPQYATASTTWFRHQWNLVKLLTHTVINHHRDNSSECRFVTLLEVALSYQKSVTSNEGEGKVVYQWKPSDDVKRFWVRLMQSIDPEMAPFDFRRKAYGVLVSLSWVPASKGLLEACSIADSRREEIPPETPLGAQRILQKIPNTPLSRNDCVYQVLDRLKDETNVSVVIAASDYNKASSSSGLGKTTIAALVASHPLIVRSFKILWLTMDYKQRDTVMAVPDVNNPITNERKQRKARLNYATYIQYLDSLCDQMGCISNTTNNEETGDDENVRPTRKRPLWPEAHSLRRLEEAAIRYRREVHLMKLAKRRMTDLLEATASNILLVLDDVSEDEELEWFHFTEQQSILATAGRQASINSADFTVELDPWGEDESIELFLLESRCSDSTVIGSAAEVKQIVSRCHYHPILVRTAARLFMLKKVTTGLIQALEEANDEFLVSTQDNQVDVAREMAAAGNDDAESLDGSDAASSAPKIPKALSKLMDQVLSPIVRRTGKPSILFKLCLASMAAVFGECQPVPLTAVLLLWEQLVIMEPDALQECGGAGIPTDELRRRVWFVAEGLTHIGLLTFTEGNNGDAFVAIHHETYELYALELVTDIGLEERPEDSYAKWHKAFVAGYLTRKFENNNCDSSHVYALKNLSKHMLYCKLYVKVAALLSNGRLYQERVEAFGRDQATSLHVKDCIHLMKTVRGDFQIPREQRNEIATGHFQKVAALLTENLEDLSKDSSALKLAKDLYAIGFGLAQNGKLVEALDLYTQAHGLVPKSSSFAATVLYGLGSLNLLLNDYGKAKKSLMASIASMKILGEDGESGKPRNALYLTVSRLQGDALMAECNYRQALAQYEETMELNADDNGFESDVEYSILLYRKGRLHQTMGEISMAAKELSKCVKWKEDVKETSQNLTEAYSALADIYAEMGSPVEARKHIDMALRTMKEVEATWPKLKYEDDEEINVEEMLLAAKFRTLRPDLPDDLTNYELIRKKLVESPVLLMDQSAYDLRYIALAYMAADEQERAVSVLEDALKMMSERVESLERALCLLCLGNSFLDQGEAEEDEKKAKTLFELALKLFEMALKIQKMKLGDCQQVLETIDSIGNLHVHLRQHVTAIAVYSEALSQAKRLKCDAEKIAGILYFLGECSEAVGQLDLAATHYKECLVGLRSGRPSLDIDLSRPLQRLGALSLIQARYNDAKQIYDEILLIREANFEPDDVLLAETRDVLGYVEMRRQQYASACGYLQDALEIRLQHEDNLRAIGDTHYQIGLSFRMRGEHANALACFKRSLSILEDVVPKDDPIIASVELAMGNTHLNQGNLTEAARLCQRALVTRRSVLGTDHRKVANAARSLGITKFLTHHDLNDACFLLQEYVRIIESLLKSQKPPRSPDHYRRKPNEYVAVLVMLSDIQVSCGRQKLAGKILSSAREICQQTTPDDKHDGSIIPEMVSPELSHMVQKRLSSPPPTSQEGKPGALHRDEKEVVVFQSIILSDD